MTMPTSYWHATHEPIVPDAELPRTSEVVVVGGGLLGCWSAYWLARSGVEVTLVERDVIGWGATGRNGGFLVGGTALGFPALIDLVGLDTARSLETLVNRGMTLAAEVIAEEGIDCDFRTPGVLSLALDDATHNGHLKTIEVVGDLRPGSQALSPDDLRAFIHTPLAEEIVGGMYTPSGGLLHSERYVCGLAAAAQRHGARIVRAAVTGVSSGADGPTVHTNRGDVSAGAVIVAANAWTDEIVPSLRGKIVPVRAQILSYSSVGRVFDCATGVDVTPTGEYWQQTPDGSIILGGCRQVAQGGDVDVREMVPTPDVTDAIEAVFPRLFPGLDGLSVDRRWAGLMAFTSDRLPIADMLEDQPCVYVTGGYCGHGMPFGPRVGQLLAQAVVNGSRPPELDPLRIDRPSLNILASSHQPPA